ncbi:hypothetical protein [Nonomuraea zeae]|uniref:hypothetical protein n=1 Tax=Nonomuraea zeae TaxID=1642303 RepID=UPI00147954B3|nr:hypothetical protein [Nonomuraea zeae]
MVRNRGNVRGNVHGNVRVDVGELGGGVQVSVLVGRRIAGRLGPPGTGCDRG